MSDVKTQSWSEILNQVKYIRNFPLPPPFPVRDCVVIERRKGETEQTAGFQSFRMRTFKVKGKMPLSLPQETQFLHGLEVSEPYDSKVAL